ncbi:NAD(P)H-dependent oxidoreductase subunit E [Hylemonella gracilis]|uniref:NAD-dependent formate dehydrogenase subunit gamma n=1 Tax=Hylemonella gracilis ATCC 19624 TaxID=887062 RepID=F3KRQ7_9BURK|nr:NAD(P)H-dependent oxidoreductase subunit E [Hylemonella gracilis]EGI77508.1 NAD-dependent formate dehydrogenase subunit gamma [Hylemonella gracilis ATCC 19624]
MNKTTGAARNHPSSPEQRAAVRAVLDARSQQAGALLPILHDIQDQLGYIPADVVVDIAEALNVSRAEVHGVITYYHHFRSEPARGAVVQVCRAEACQSCGSEALWEHASKKAAGQNVTLEPVYCLGLCATAPAVQIQDKFHARVTPTKFDRLLAQLKEAA